MAPAPTSTPMAPPTPARVRNGSRVRRIAGATRRGTAASVAESGRIWQTHRSTRPERARTEPRFDAGSWLVAILAMSLFVALLWAVQIVDATQHYSFNRFGLVPRELHGLWGVLTQPFLHSSYRDMLSDTLPVLLIGWVVLLAGARIWLTVTLVVVLVGGALAWVIGPHVGSGQTEIVGSSALVFGWLGYLVCRAIFSRKITWILTAAMVLLVFGALLGQLVPVAHSNEAWQVHLAGFVAGGGVGWLLHPRRRSARAQRRRPPATAVS